MQLVLIPVPVLHGCSKMPCDRDRFRALFRSTCWFGCKRHGVFRARDCPPPLSCFPSLRNDGSKGRLLSHGALNSVQLNCFLQIGAPCCPGVPENILCGPRRQEQDKKVNIDYLTGITVSSKLPLSRLGRRTKSGMLHQCLDRSDQNGTD